MYACVIRVRILRNLQNGVDAWSYVCHYKSVARKQMMPLAPSKPCTTCIVVIKATGAAAEGVNGNDMFLAAANKEIVI